MLQQPVCADGRPKSGLCFKASWLTHHNIPRRIWPILASVTERSEKWCCSILKGHREHAAPHKFRDIWIFKGNVLGQSSWTVFVMLLCFQPPDFLLDRISTNSWRFYYVHQVDVNSVCRWAASVQWGLEIFLCWTLWEWWQKQSSCRPGSWTMSWNWL